MKDLKNLRDVALKGSMRCPPTIRSHLETFDFTIRPVTIETKRKCVHIRRVGLYNIVQVNYYMDISQNE